MKDVKTGICPYYKYKVTFNSEIITCEANHASVVLIDPEKFNEFVVKMPYCLEVYYEKCPEYKNKMKEFRNSS